MEKPSLHEAAILCVKRYKKSESELIAVLSEIDKVKAYLELGVPSLFAYCVQKLQLAESETSRIIQVVRKSFEVPALKKAIDDGVLTVSKASRISSVITVDTQEDWISKASQLTHRQLEREVVSANPKAVRSERIEAKTSEVSELRVNISKELEGKLLRAKAVFRTRSLEETLEKMTDFALKHKDPIEKAKRNAPQHVTCNTRSQPDTRYIKASLRHEVNLRDKGKCRYLNCQSSHWVEIHHIRPLSEGGRHELSNLISLCSAHHSMMHGFQKTQYQTSRKKGVIEPRTF